ncbi:MAG TPA: hypothetical protein VGE79_13755 [Niastella sp.]
MKSYDDVYNDLLKQYTPAEIAESFVFPGPTDKKQREVMLSAFREWRKKKSDEQTEERRVISRSLQLKYVGEDNADAL